MKYFSWASRIDQQHPLFLQLPVIIVQLIKICYFSTPKYCLTTALLILATALI